MLQFSHKLIFFKLTFISQIYFFISSMLSLEYSFITETFYICKRIISEILQN